MRFLYSGCVVAQHQFDQAVLGAVQETLEQYAETKDSFTHARLERRSSDSLIIFDILISSSEGVGEAFKEAIKAAHPKVHRMTLMPFQQGTKKQRETDALWLPEISISLASNQDRDGLFERTLAYWKR